VTEPLPAILDGWARPMSEIEKAQQEGGDRNVDEPKIKVGGKLVPLAEHRANSLAGSQPWRDERAATRRHVVLFARMRIQAGDSRAEIAKALGVPKRTLNHWLHAGQQ
jgi:hypothetical protein